MYVAIQVLKGNKTEEEMKAALRNIRDLDLNASTRRMIHFYIHRDI